jgi:hypothetical protein
MRIRKQVYILSVRMKNAPFGAFAGFNGGRGIRTPGSVTYNSFQDCRVKPLCHSSGTKVGEIFVCKT